MSLSVSHWIEQLKLARKHKGLTQVELGEKVGMPQSYVSKVEGGSIDIRLSSLLEMARVLELEPVLVPRQLVPAVQSLMRSQSTNEAPGSMVVRPAYALDEGEADG